MRRQTKLDRRSVMTKLTETKNRLGRMDNRLNLLEEEIKRSKYQRMKYFALKQKEKEQVNNELGIGLMDQSAGRLRSNFQPEEEQLERRQQPVSQPEYQPTETYMEGDKHENQLERRLQTDFQPENQIDGRNSIRDQPEEREFMHNRINYQSTFQSDFANEMEADKFKNDKVKDKEIKEKENKRKNDKEGEIKDKKDDKEKEVKKKTKGMKALRRWFGDDTQSEVDSSSSSAADTDKEDEETNEWKKTDRKLKNKQKKKQSDRKKQERMELNARKAKHIIGLGKIITDSINHFKKTTKHFKDAKELAVQEYLEYCLMFSREEVEMMEIGETQISGKGDDIVYVAFTDIDSIKDIHKRMSELKDDTLAVRNYIPPQYYKKIHVFK